MKPRKKNDETNEMSEITNPAIAEEFVGASGRQTTMGADLPYVTGADLPYVTGSEGLYVTGSDGPYVTCADLTAGARTAAGAGTAGFERSEEQTSELQSRFDIVCRLHLEKNNST